MYLQYMFTEHEDNSSKKSLLLMKKSQEFQGFDSRPILITSYFFLFIT